MYHDEYPTIDSNLTDSNEGCRKNRNIQDNIFVIQAILNETKHGSKQPIDISVYDVNKCFDSLWVQECINDMYDAGDRNDKLNILHLLNQNALVAVKTSSGLSERRSIQNVIMQGTVWGACSAQPPWTSLENLSNKTQTVYTSIKAC